MSRELVRTPRKSMATVTVMRPPQLGGSLPQGTEELLQPTPRFLSYGWYREEHYARVIRHLQAAVVAHQEGISIEFFMGVVEDVYDLDRALRMAEAIGEEPIRRTDIPDIVRRTVTTTDTVRFRAAQTMLSDIVVPLTQQKTERYDILKRPFVWDERIPDDAVDAAAQVLETQPPDEFWIAEYRHCVERKRSWYRVVYAQYGEWYVEVARWE